MSGIANEIYSDTASVGRFYAIFQAIIGTIVALILILIGILIINHRKHLVKTTAVVSADSVAKNTEVCQEGKCNNVTTYLTTISFTVNDKVISATIPTAINYKREEKLVIFFNPSDPAANVETTDLSPLGWGMIILGAIILIGVWIWVYIVRRYKMLAAVEGTAAGISVIKNAL